MKSKIAVLLFVFSLVSLLISFFQFKRGDTLEAILSLVYFSVFLAGGIIYKSKIGTEVK